MDQLCDTPFWDLNVTWYTENPDFTECFKKTALQWIPCFYLWMFLPFEIYNLKTSKMRDIPFNKFNVIKLVAIICITGISVAELMDALMHNTKMLADIYSPVIKIFTFVLFLLLTWGNMKMGIISSGTLFVFSFLLVICGIPSLRDTLKLHITKTEIIPSEKTKISDNVFIVYYLITILIFFLNCFADERPRYSSCGFSEKPCPAQSSSVLSNLMYSWFTEYAWKGYRKPINDILWYVDYDNSAAGILPKFEKYFKAASTRKRKSAKLNEEDFDDIPLKERSILNENQTRYSIIGPILRLTWLRITEAFFWKAIDTVLAIAPSLIFSCLITVINQKEPIWKAYACVIFFFISPLINYVALRNYFEATLKVQLHFKTVTLSSVYKKALKVSNKRSSDVLNVMSVDIMRIYEFIRLMNYIWSSPLQIILVIYFLWDLFGVATITSIILLVLIVILNHYLVKFSKTLRVKEMQCKDKRNKFLQEILSGIKVLKMYAWEPSFEKVAFDLRQNELRNLKKIAITNVISTLFFVSVQYLLPLATFATYTLCDADSVLDVKKAFVCISLFNSFRVPMYQLPNLFASTSQAYVSIQRINNFLNLEELDNAAVTHDDRKEALIIEKGTFSWENNLPDSTVLRDINIKIKDGSLVAIVGPVGAGKSSLISAFLGEMYKISGYINVKGTTAYVPQQAWILNSSFKENITMKDAVDETFYNKAIEACALKTDLEAMSDGDMTEIGEKGINLSGGQKQRVSVARALCSKKDIYFFDDPLSAVDHNVAEQIFHHVLGPEGMLRDKTRVLVTHNTAFLHKMDLIIVLKNGIISESGTFNELRESNKEFSEFLKNYHDNVGEKSETRDNQELNQLKAEHNFPKVHSVKKTDLFNENVQKNNNQHDELSRDENKKPKKLIKNELVKSGNIKANVYWYYIKAAGPYLALSSIILYFVFQALSVISNTWLAEWTTVLGSPGTPHEKDRYYYLNGYIVIVILQEIVSLLAVAIVYKFILQASVSLYEKLIFKVLRWPMWMFDCTPIGRIINRFTVDIDDIDNGLGLRTNTILIFTTKLIAVLFVILCNTPGCVILVIPLAILMYIVQKFYMVLSNQLKRIESVYRSPLYSQFVETTSGLESIRAYNMQEKFTKLLLEKNDLCSATTYSVFVCWRWLGARMNLLTGLFISFTTFYVVFERDRFSEGFMAFIISFTLEISKEVSWLALTLAEVQNVIVSVERVKEFIESPQEADSHQSKSINPSNWPARGEIIFENYNLKYRQELDLVLKNINFVIKSGEKVGVIGRTGAGKSSIILALFRIVEPTNGKILIDGVDISTIGLSLLRSKLTVIPQDPVLFVGSLRFNLDPFDNYTDETLWNILDKAHLKNFVRGLPNGLHHDVEKGGGNLSYGQKQLICLARALLRRTKILVLDEATASVDLETDQLIQNTIRKEFSDCTIITIAHRINTVQDYDKILVIDDGKVMEFDTPANLLRNKETMFYKAASNSGMSITR